MPATYPTSVQTFTTKQDFVDTVVAEHVNRIQNEVSAIETSVGTAILTGSGWVGSFDQVTSTWNTLKDRINNIEYGLGSLYGDAVRMSGGSTIQSSTTSTVSLIVKAKASQTADFIQFQNSSGSTVSKVDSSGNFYLGTRQLVPVIYASSQPSSVPAGTIWVDSSSSVSTFTSSSGIPSGGSANQFLLKSSATDYDTAWSSNVNYGIFKSPIESANIVASAATGTINIDVETSSIWYYTSAATANHTINFRYNGSTSLSSKLDVGKAITCVWMVTNDGSHTYYPNTIQVDGTAVTVGAGTLKWASGIAPTSGNSSSVDIYSFVIIKTASTPTYLVLGTQTKFA